jgi:hypothetical protein
MSASTLIIENSEEIFDLESGVLGQVSAVNAVPHLVQAEQSPQSVGSECSRDLLYKLI